jgi:hypothetical protein
VANTSTVHFIIDRTLGAANTLGAVFAEKGACVTFRVRNNDAAAVLYMKTSDANDNTSAVPIPANTWTEWMPVIPSGIQPYDLTHLRFRSSAANAAFTVEYIKA